MRKKSWLVVNIKQGDLACDYERDHSGFSAVRLYDMRSKGSVSVEALLEVTQVVFSIESFLNAKNGEDCDSEEDYQTIN